MPFPVPNLSSSDRCPRNGTAPPGVGTSENGRALARDCCSLAGHADSACIVDVVDSERKRLNRWDR